MKIQYVSLVLFANFTHSLFSMENTKTQIAAIERSLNGISAHYVLYLTQYNNSARETFKTDYLTAKDILMQNLSAFLTTPALKKHPKAIQVVTLCKQKIEDLQQIESNCCCSKSDKLLSNELSFFVN